MSDIRKNWMIILMLAGLIGTWATFATRLANAENKIEQLSQVVVQINQLNVDIAVIKANVEFIKTNINK